MAFDGNKTTQFIIKTLAFGSLFFLTFSLTLPLDAILCGKVDDVKFQFSNSIIYVEWHSLITKEQHSTRNYYLMSTSTLINFSTKKYKFRIGWSWQLMKPFSLIFQSFFKKITNYYKLRWFSLLICSMCVGTSVKSARARDGRPFFIQKAFFFLFPLICSDVNAFGTVVNKKSWFWCESTLENVIDITSGDARAHSIVYKHE